MCWVFRKRSFSVSGTLAKLYADAIRLHSNSNKVKFGVKRLDNSGVLLMITAWRVVGFIESEDVKWSDFQRLSKNEMFSVVENKGFIFNEL
jgi:hypothetical protein